MLFKKTTQYILATLMLCCINFTTALADDGDKVSINANVGYVNISDYPSGSNQINSIRLTAIREAATQLGATGALAWRSEQINHSLNQQGQTLDGIFNFNRLILEHNVLPPVITESDNNLNLASTTSIRAAAKTYKLISPARFVTTPPTWRNYLIMNYKKPNIPNRALLPTTQVEARTWNAFFKQGWQQGLEQAKSIFNINLSELKRDYSGMLLYRKLLSEHMVNSPYVSQADLGVTGNSHELRIGDTVTRITGESKLQTNSNKWLPIFTSN